MINFERTEHIKMNELPTNSNTGDGDSEPLDYLRGVKSSTCLLLPTTPSPTPPELDFKHPLSEEINEAPFITLNDDPNMVNLENSEACGGDSSSSGDSNSVVQDPVSAQLINNISMLDYQTLSKNGDLILGQVEECKLNGNLKIKNRKLPNFVNWNWSVIRKVLLWVVISGLVACLGAIIAMIINIPKECDPDLPWYHGKVFYEIFPASFEDSNNDGIGDLKGIVQKLDYIQGLGATAIRLNYIFKANDYPEKYFNTTSLLEIDRSIGLIKDFEDLVSEVHKKNMYIILDIPIKTIPSSNMAGSGKLLPNDTSAFEEDETTEAIKFWAQVHKVDGFYLKNLEKFVNDINFSSTLCFWKHLIGNDKIFIASEEAAKKAQNKAHNYLMSRIDLIDIHIELTNGTTGLKNRINDIINGILWHRPHYPWVHWNIGDMNSERISTKYVNNTLVITALEFVLPGTVSIFYGDEIGLGGLSVHEIEGDFHGHEHVHNLVPMLFLNNNKSENTMGILPWNGKSSLEPKYNFLKFIKNLTVTRLKNPTIYLRAIYKEGSLSRNTEIRQTLEFPSDLLVIERWFPRRNTCVFVGNFGSKSITTDLSTMYYGGTVLAGTNASLIGQILYFEHVTFPPNSAIILKLEK